MPLEGKTLAMRPKKENQKTSKKEGINLLYFKDENKEINKRKLIGLIILCVLLIAIIVVYIVYTQNESFRKILDEKLLKKNIEEEKLKTIKIEDYDTSNIFAFSKYIAILKSNELEIYNSMGKLETKLKLEITNPISDNSGKYLVVAEQNASKVYMVADNSVKWDKQLEGNISRVNVNENGYVSVILTGTTYKSVVVLLDNKGNEIFKTYLSNTIAIDSSISADDKYLGIAEVNPSGTLIQSNVKIVSIDKAKDTPSEAIVYTYNAPSNSLILNVEYQNKTKLVCMYNDEIHTIKDNIDSKFINLNTQKEKITFASINLENSIVENIEEKSGLFNTNTKLKIVNTNTEKSSEYNFNGVTKELYCSGNKIALNLGSEIHFIAPNGWLIKKYISNQEIRKIVLTDEIAGIVYRNKIEIVKF